MKERKQAIKTVVALIVFTVLLIYFVNHTFVITGFLSTILGLITPFILGCGIAFVVNIPMRGIEKSLFKNKESKLYKYKRVISMLLAYVCVVLVIVLVLMVVVPEVIETFHTIREKFPGFVNKVKDWALNYTKNYPDIEKEIRNYEPDWDAISSMFISKGGSILSMTVSIFSSIVSALINTLIGIVFSLYILAQKETLARQTKLFLYAAFKESTADEFLVFGKIANTTFAKFFTCQFREGIILGSMFAIAMAIIGMPFPLTIGVLIAFTALIPIFGAFFGLFIGCFLLLVDSPSYVVGFIILFFVLQFIENYFIYPKLVGGGIGLSAIWVLLAVLVGGDLMGIVGMFIFIPLVSVLYSYARSIIYRKLKKKNINVDEKEAPDDVMPLQENRRRGFQKRSKEIREEKEANKDV